MIEHYVDDYAYDDSRHEKQLWFVVHCFLVKVNGNNYFLLRVNLLLELFHPTGKEARTLKICFPYVKMQKTSWSSGQMGGWMDEWMTCDFTSCQQYLSHIRTMGG